VRNLGCVRDQLEYKCYARLQRESVEGFNDFRIEGHTCLGMRWIKWLRWVSGGHEEQDMEG